jgi:hypothetical protein
MCCDDAITVAYGGMKQPHAVAQYAAAQPQSCLLAGNDWWFKKQTLIPN